MNTPTHSSQILSLPHGDVRMPAFLPDATFGVVRGADASDMQTAGVQALVMNVFHLMQRPGSSSIQSLGGLHKMSGWSGPIVTDSGGFQAYSLVRNDPSSGTLSDRGISYKPEGAKRRFQLSPEKSIQLQIAYGADVIICLDDCTHADDTQENQEISVNRTIAWAHRCKKQYTQLMDEKGIKEGEWPKLFAVIQGGNLPALRKQCAQELLEIGFDGYGYGGWPLDRDGNLLTEMLTFTRELIPDQYPMHALGVGHPQSIAKCVHMGYGLFDSALPTRDARRGRLYSLRNGISAVISGENWFRYLYIQDDKFKKKNEPIQSDCDCFACENYSIGYLHHLFKMNDSLYTRLATIHNIRFVTAICAHLRGE